MDISRSNLNRRAARYSRLARMDDSERISLVTRVLRRLSAAVSSAQRTGSSVQGASTDNHEHSCADGERSERAREPLTIRSVGRGYDIGNKREGRARGREMEGEGYASAEGVTHAGYASTPTHGRITAVR